MEHIDGSRSLRSDRRGRANAARLRGSIIADLARGEAAVSKTLIALGGATPRLPHLLGQKLEALDALLVATAPDGKTKRAKEALDLFRRHKDLRDLLCHGVGERGTIRGQPVLLLDLCHAEAGRHRPKRWIKAAEAEPLRRTIAADAQRLAARLQVVTTRMTTDAVVPA